MDMTRLERFLIGLAVTLVVCGLITLWALAVHDGHLDRSAHWRACTTIEDQSLKTLCIHG